VCKEHILGDGFGQRCHGLVVFGDDLWGYQRTSDVSLRAQGQAHFPNCCSTLGTPGTPGTMTQLNSNNSVFNVALGLHVAKKTQDERSRLVYFNFKK
jgi:hypothetical protein